MKINKTIIAAFALTLTLASCENMVSNKNTEESPVVEEVQEAETVDTNEAINNEASDVTTDEAITDEAATTEDDADSMDASSDEMNTADESTDSTTVAGSDRESQIMMLEEAIFDLRSKARAAEILLELSPEKVEDIRPELEELLAESEERIASANALLKRLKNQQ